VTKTEKMKMTEKKTTPNLKMTRMEKKEKGLEVMKALRTRKTKKVLVVGVLTPKTETMMVSPEMVTVASLILKEVRKGSQVKVTTLITRPCRMIPTKPAQTATMVRENRN
jgi:hypothetical protein